MQSKNIVLLAIALLAIVLGITASFNTAYASTWNE